MPVDFSLAPATLLHRALRENVAKPTNKTDSATWLARGELDKEEYVRLLMMLWHVYEYAHPSTPFFLTDDVRSGQ